ncbi:MAG: Stp1/IreP family PP2C-type Ser/Thr phosphatase [Peptococcaceae bacterium]|nr:Stp1/IreP family PP2C-type Ser/Thr phosphatase [Peptococcaceae bacterium]
MRWAYASEAGLVRPKNEDSCYIDGDLGLFAVADGMGGHVAGEVASKMALEVFSREVEGRLMQGDEAEAALVAGVMAANNEVFVASRRNKDYEGMGTTLAAAVVRDRELLTAHVGDSRIYLVRDGRIFQLTEDHSLVQQLVREGKIDNEEAQHHPYRNILSRALGTQELLKVDTVRYPLRNSDRIILCTDGLTNLVSDREICDITCRYALPDPVVKGLVETALERGGIDNITIIVVVVEEL